MRRISMMAAVLVLAGCGTNETAETLDKVWADMNTGRRLDLCAEVRTAGVDAAADAFVTGVGDSIDRGDVHAWLSERCGD